MKRNKFLTAIITLIYCLSTLTVCLFFGCAPAPIENGDNNPDAIIPVVVEEYRELYHPTENVGIYMNDHTVFKSQHSGAKNKWNVIGITNTVYTSSTDERHFANGVGDSLAKGNFTNNPGNGGICMSSSDRSFREPTPNPVRPGSLCWAPHVVYDGNGTYHMYYFSDLTARWRMGYAVSTDLVNWSDRTDELTLTIANPNYPGLIYQNGDVAETRDPMLFKYEDKWLMYTTSQYNDNGVRRGAVALYESENLTDWVFVGFPFKNVAGSHNASYSPCESPYLIQKGNKFILSVCNTISDWNTYHDSLLFISDNPYDFGEYAGVSNLSSCDTYLTRISAHCPEFIRDDETGRWYVTSAGWPDRVKYDGVQGGVGIAEIIWLTPKEYEDYIKNTCSNHKSGVLNHSFENGTLENWVTTGNFDAHMLSSSEATAIGNYRDKVGSYMFCSYADGKNGANGQKGSMSSNVFTIAKNGKMSFIIFGDKNETSLYVALVDYQTNEILLKTTGKDYEDGFKITWDISKYAGKDAYVTVVDSSQSEHIGIDCILVDGIAKNVWPE